MFQRDTLVLELLCCPNDIRHMPAQDGVFRCRYFWNISNSKHGSSRVEYERKFVLANQLQTKDIPIEFLGANGVASGDECHKFLGLQHRLLSLGVSRLISSANLATWRAMRLVSTRSPLSPRHAYAVIYLSCDTAR